ncbi:MAG: nucleotidyltransferase family protein [Planctomycetota bacterium]|nr:MAG: nucleotidyltransferase family protein [Planctomycetota bacterium]
MNRTDASDALRALASGATSVQAVAYTHGRMPKRPIECRVLAIVPAAGRSRRMGRDKQLIPIGGRPMLLDVIENLRASKVAAIVVVTRTEIAAAALPPGKRTDRVRVLFNDDPRSEMIDSIRLALREFADKPAPDGVQSFDGVLVCPADQPGISAADHNRCIDVFAESSDRIIVATCGPRRGHPIIFPAAMIEFVLSDACDAGLRELPHRHADRVLEVPCVSRGVVRDIDTPDDLPG